jgi:hypothetical protein
MSYLAARSSAACGPEETPRVSSKCSEYVAAPSELSHSRVSASSEIEHA